MCQDVTNETKTMMAVSETKPDGMDVSEKNLEAAPIDFYLVICLCEIGEVKPA